MPRGVYDRSKSKKELDSRSVAIENGARDIDINRLLAGDEPAIEVVSENAMGRLSDEVFANEMVEVHIHEPVQDNEASQVFVGVDGECMWLMRGGTYNLKRKHVEVLARAKTGRVMQKRIISPDGSQSYVDTEVLMLAYPFSVTHDANPRGGVWLREILKQA